MVAFAACDSSAAGGEMSRVPLPASFGDPSGGKYCTQAPHEHLSCPEAEGVAETCFLPDDDGCVVTAYRMGQSWFIGQVGRGSGTHTSCECAARYGAPAGVDGCEFPAGWFAGNCSFQTAVP